MPGANAPDADGNLPTGSYAGMNWKYDSQSPNRMGMMVNGKLYNSNQLELINGPQGRGYYVKSQFDPSHIPNTQGGQVASNSGINQGGSYYPTSQQTGYEHQAGVPANQYMSDLDANGNLKSPFQVDPSRSAAFNAMEQNATSTDLSPWALMQQQALGNQTQQLRDSTNAQQQGQTDQAMDKLMTSGNGMDSGSRALLAGMGSRANLMANQNIGAQQVSNDLGIRQADAQNKAQMLGQVANTQTSAQAANANTGIQDLTNENIFSSNRYNQQMQAWGAQQTANAQSRAAGGGKK